MEKYEINKYLDSFKEKVNDFYQSLNIETLREEFSKLDKEINNPNLWDNPSRAQEIINKSNQIKENISIYDDSKSQLDDMINTLDIIDEDPQIAIILEEEILAFDKKMSDLEIRITLSEPYDDNGVIMEFHPGAGGTESMDWASMLFRMYQRYSAKKGFKFNILDYQPGEAGIKSATVEITGKYAYGLLKGERGVHRLVRISPFDANKRRHTSFASIDIAPVIENNNDIEIKDEEIRIDTYCSSGAGGQGVNTTYSAVRVTHIPTNIVVTCQNERSQIKNKEIALKVLRSKLFERKIKEEEETIKKLKGEQMDIGFGSQIRSYVFCPYTLVKDHRTNHEVGNIQAVMDGEIEDFIRAFLKMNARK